MKPAPSIIGFTTVSGLGYGLLFVLAMGALSGLIPTERWLGVVGFVLALGSITAGLLASTLHLGHPERAWRAVSQWRSSWLSREGLLAIVTYVPAVWFASGWVLTEELSGVTAFMAVAAAAGAVATVYCTGMIYASLPPIKAWHQPLTAPIYLAFALMTGLLAAHFLLTLFGVPQLVVGLLAVVAVIGAFALKFIYWKTVAQGRSSGSTAERATGLTITGLVRLLDPPHTQTNYLMDEMGFQVGRKHARILRSATYLFGLAMPLILTVLTLLQDHWLSAVLALLAFLSAMLGVVIERWLFFAEAEHTVMLYYGGRGPDHDQVVTSSVREKRRDTSSTAEKPRRRRASPIRKRTRAANPPSEGSAGEPSNV